MVPRNPSPLSLPVIEPWYKDGLSFQCTQCGNCCTGGPGYVWMSDVEIDRLATHLKMERAAVLKKYCRKLNGKISLKETLRGELYDCVFLTEYEEGGKTKRGCSIYPVRPLQCRTWPFWDGLLASEAAWKRTKKMCPGMDKGKGYTLEQIEKLRNAKDWPQKEVTPGSGAK